MNEIRKRKGLSCNKIEKDENKFVKNYNDMFTVKLNFYLNWCAFRISHNEKPLWWAVSSNYP